MLSVFPQLLPFSLLGIFLIRITIGLVILYISYQILFKNREKLINKLNDSNLLFSKISVWIIGIALMLSSLFVFTGFLTQVSTVVCAYLLLNVMFLDNGKEKVLKQTNLFYFTLIIICLSFLFLGPGFFAIDLPL